MHIMLNCSGGSSAGDRRGGVSGDGEGGPGGTRFYRRSRSAGKSNVLRWTRSILYI